MGITGNHPNSPMSSLVFLSITKEHIGSSNRNTSGDFSKSLSYEVSGESRVITIEDHRRFLFFSFLLRVSIYLLITFSSSYFDITTSLEIIKIRCFAQEPETFSICKYNDLSLNRYKRYTEIQFTSTMTVQNQCTLNLY